MPSQIQSRNAIAPTHSQPGHTILVVDDEPFIVEMLEDYLKEQYHVLTATSGDAALQLLKQHPEIDIIISDQRMPGISGIDLLKKSLETHPNAERIIITAYADLESVLEGLNEARISYYFPKPIDLYQIKLAVQQLAEKIDLWRSNLQLIEQLKEQNRLIEQKISERTKELQLALQQLREHQILQQRFFNIAVHDLKNPLSTLRIICSELQKIVGDRPEAQQLFTMVEEPLNTMEQLVQDILTITRLQSAEPGLEIQPINLQELLQAVIYEFRPQAQRKNITLTLQLPEDLPIIEGDYRRLKQVFDNLISNGIKYTPPGGKVLLTASADSANVTITVQDTGLGMTTQDLEKVFGEFQTLSAKPTGGESSTGLGLFIAKKIVALHHGKITAYSEGPGKGSTFTVVLPIRQPKTEQSNTTEITH